MILTIPEDLNIGQAPCLIILHFTILCYWTPSLMGSGLRRPEKPWDPFRTLVFQAGIRTKRPSGFLSTVCHVRWPYVDLHRIINLFQTSPPSTPFTSSALNRVAYSKLQGCIQQGLSTHCSFRSLLLSVF